MHPSFNTVNNGVGNGEVRMTADKDQQDCLLQPPRHDKRAAYSYCSCTSRHPLVPPRFTELHVNVLSEAHPRMFELRPTAFTQFYTQDSIGMVQIAI